MKHFRIAIKILFLSCLASHASAKEPQTAEEITGHCQTSHKREMSLQCFEAKVINSLNPLVRDIDQLCKNIVTNAINLNPPYSHSECLEKAVPFVARYAPPKTGLRDPSYMAGLTLTLAVRYPHWDQNIEIARASLKVMASDHPNMFIYRKEGDSQNLCTQFTKTKRDYCILIDYNDFPLGQDHFRDFLETIRRGEASRIQPVPLVNGGR